MAGQQQVVCQALPTGSKMEKQVNLTGFAKGISIVQLKIETQVTSQRLVIQ